MYRAGKQFLESRGFQQVTPYDFERRAGDRSSSYVHGELFRRPLRYDHDARLGFDAWGWGFAGISFFFRTPASPGWAYINQVHVDDYFRDIDNRQFPVMRGFHYSVADLRIHLLFQELQGLSIDRANHQALFGRDVVPDFSTIWQTLEQLGWVQIDAERVSLQGDGVFYLPLIQNLLAVERSEEMRRRRSDTSTDTFSYPSVDRAIAAKSDVSPAQAVQADCVVMD